MNLSTRLFGPPLLHCNAMDNALGASCDDLNRAIFSLELFSARDALLLQACFSAPKIIHILRCSTCSDHIRLLQFDLSFLRDLFVITNSDRTYIQWIQINLSIRAGVFEVRRVATRASFTSSASAASARNLKSQLLLNCNPAPAPHVDTATHDRP